MPVGGILLPLGPASSSPATNVRDIAFELRGQSITYKKFLTRTQSAAGGVSLTFDDTVISEALPSMVSDEDVAASNGRYQNGDVRVRVRATDIPETPPSQRSRFVWDGITYQITQHSKSLDLYVYDLYGREV